MNTDPKVRFACNKQFAELCALSTTGSLTDEEWQQLERHIAVCDKCRAVLADYQSLASDGMAKVAAELTVAGKLQHPEHVWAQDEAKARLLSKLAGAQPSRANPAPQRMAQEVPSPTTHTAAYGRNAMMLLRVAAVLAISVLVAYQLGVRRGLDRAASRTASPNVELSLRQQLADLLAQRDALNNQLAADSKTINDLKDRASRREKELAQLKGLKASLEERTQQLGIENHQQSESLGSISVQRDALQHKLKDTENSLQAIRDGLGSLEKDREKALLRAVSLEDEIGRLSARMQQQDETVQRQEQFLASDRDIRELMGARQLYIADVFDVDQHGKPRKPYGRVFYTKGKSLIFYAFDLEKQPGFREAKAFQAWGRPDQDQSQPISLGVFYMDSESNRRWVLKSSDPRVLAQIDAVFVTVEPKGGSKKPTGKPFLYAYLRTAPPNHP